MATCKSKGIWQMTNKLTVTWAEYHQLIEKLAILIHRSGWHFNGIVCLARGGLRVGDILSRIFHCPLAILATSSYQGQQQGKLKIAHSLTMTTDKLPDRILLVDDLVDSGETLRQTIDWLYEHHEVQTIKTAVLWYKDRSKFSPDYVAEYLPGNIWIEQPFEIYEKFNFTTENSPI